jgi:FKBP-type peptidyl-prolyl cis-trans isomerase (trigger factor)
MASKIYKNIKVNPLPKREVEITGEITAEAMSDMRTKALTKLKETVELDGFRKGNAPENMIVAKVGEMAILEEASELALSQAYPEILDEEKIDAIGRPQINITKMAPGNPLEFKIKTSLSPDIKLGDYKKIAEESKKEDKGIEVTDEEIETVIMEIRRSVAHSKMHQHGNLEEHDHSHGEIKDEDLPEMDEQFLKEIGGFATVEDLKAKIKENLAYEKEAKAKDKHRTGIIEKIIEDSKMDIPQIIIDAEIEKMLAQFKDDVARSGISYEEYLTHIKKSEDDIKKEWQETAEKRAKAQIVLHEISKEEGIRPEEESIKSEMEKILAHDKNLERFRVRMFVENFLTNDLVFKFLENLPLV